MKTNRADSQFERETLMKPRLFLLALLFSIAAGMTLAHGTKVHLRGTVEKISADSVLIKTAEGKSVEVKYVSWTVCLSRDNKGAKPAKEGELAIGDLVVIHATPKNNTLEADEIKFSLPNAGKGTAPISPKQ